MADKRNREKDSTTRRGTRALERDTIEDDNNRGIRVDRIPARRPAVMPGMPRTTPRGTGTRSPLRNP